MSSLRIVHPPRSLADSHREQLQKSALTSESIELAGFYTERNNKALADLVNWTSWKLGEALVIPFFLPDGTEPFFCRVKPNSPRAEKTKEGKESVIKYEQPKGKKMAPYFPARSRHEGRLKDASMPLVFTEGEKKAALIDQLGFACVGLTGVSCAHDVDYKKQEGKFRLHALIREHVELKGREVRICFDGDARKNNNVLWAARVLATMVRDAGASNVRLVLPPEGDAKGIDDYAHIAGVDAARAAISAEGVELDPIDISGSAFSLKSSEALRDAPVPGALRIPFGWEVQSNGQLWQLPEKDQDPKLAERSVILISKILNDLYSGHENIELCFKRNDAWKKATVSRRAIAEAKTAIAELAPIGAPIDSNTASSVVKWMRDFEAENERRIPRESSVQKCGWHRIEGKDVFLLGNECLGSSELVFDARGDKSRLASALTQKGTIEGHKAAVRSAVEADTNAALAVFAALAAPLLKILGAPLFGVHLVGDSSRGKSSMLRVAASIYGNPRSDDWVASWNSTTVGHEVRAQTLCDLPLPIDEVGVGDTRSRETSIYMLLNGVGRTRGAREGGLRETASWRTVLLSTGEAMLADEDAATGAQVRVLQLFVNGFGDMDAAGVDSIVSGVSENFGHIGHEWLETFVKNPEKWEALREKYKTALKQFQNAAVGGSLRARQAHFFAVLAVAEDLAASFGIFGEKGGGIVRRAFLDVSERAEIRTAAERALDVVGEWWSSNPNQFVKLERSPSNSLMPKSEYRGTAPIVAYYTDREIFFLPSALRNFLRDRGMSLTVVSRDWRAKGIVFAEDGRCQVYRRIGGGKMRVVEMNREAANLQTDAEELIANEF